MLETNFTSLFLPDWWRNLFVETFVLTRNGCDYATLIGKTRFLPVLSIAQLKSLIYVIDSLQRQLLANRQSKVTLSCGNKERHLLSVLATARLLCPHTTKTCSCPLFSAEVWEHEFTSLQLCLSSYGRELLLGYCDPHADLVRQTKGEIQLGQLGHHAPLHLWKSVWLDMRGWEQLIYLRLEKEAQHTASWINLDCSISKSLSCLTVGLACEKTAMRVIAALGKKLTEHGHLAPFPSPAPIFLEDKDETQLVWKLQRFLDIKKYQDAYLKAVCSCFFNTESVLMDLVSLICPDRRPVAHRLQQEFTSLFDRPDFACEILTMLTPNSPLSDVSLFYEWCLRGLSNTLPLPTEFSGSEAVSAIMPQNTRPLAQRFRAFKDYWLEHSDLAPVLTTESMVCLASVCSRQSLSGRSFSASNLPPSSVLASPSNTKQHTDDGRRPVTKRPVYQLPHMQKIAALELRKISSTPDEYRKLEYKYLASLSSEMRESILEIKKRMQARVFENHLRPRLISFMIENPLAWERTKAIRDLGIFD